MSIVVEEGLLRQCFSKLEEHGVGVDVREAVREAGALDALATLSHGGKRQEYRIQLRQHLNSSDIHRVREFSEMDPRPLLVLTPKVTRQRARLFFDAGVQFIDTGGNMNLSLPDLTIRISGEPVPDLKTKPKKPSWKESTVRGAFAILDHSFETKGKPWSMKLQWLAEHARISLGAASGVRKSLEDLGCIAKFSDGYAVMDVTVFYRDWVDAYCRVLYQKLTIKTVRTTDLELEGVWGRGSAAKLATGNLLPEVEALYIDEVLSKWTFLHAGKCLSPGEPGETGGHKVELRDVFWALKPDQKMTSHLLTYADLVASEEGRNIEIAEEIYERYIRPGFESFDSVG